MRHPPEDGYHWNFKVGWSAQIGMIIVYLVVSSWDIHEVLSNPSSTAEYGIPLIAVAIVFGSILAHELGHAITMELAGIRVQTIGLEIWGGYTSPADDVSLFSLATRKYFWTTFAGPATNLLIALAIWQLLGAPGVTESRQILRDPDDLARFFFAWGALINAYLGVVNLLPVFPLDGGHVFRALLMGLIGGVVIPTVIAGGVSLTLAGAGITYAIIETLNEGWSAVADTGPLLVYSGVAMFGSIGALASLFQGQQKPGAVTPADVAVPTPKMTPRRNPPASMACAFCEGEADFKVHGDSQREIDLLLDHIARIHRSRVGTRLDEQRTYTVLHDGRTQIASPDGTPLILIDRGSPPPGKPPYIETPATPQPESTLAERASTFSWLWWILGIAIAIGVLIVLNSSSEDESQAPSRALPSETPVPAFGTISSEHLRDGDCFNGGFRGVETVEIETVDRVSCEGPWQYQIVRSVLLGHASGVSYPTDQYIDTFVADNCPRTISRYFYPDAIGWSQGDRTVHCIQHNLNAADSNTPGSDADSETVLYTELRDGDCFNGGFAETGTATIETVDRVSCDGPWQNQIIRTVLLGHAEGVPYPTESFFEDFVEDNCPPTTTRYFFPLREGWNLGDRVMHCISQADE